MLNEEWNIRMKQECKGWMNERITEVEDWSWMSDQLKPERKNAEINFGNKMNYEWNE